MHCETARHAKVSPIGQGKPPQGFPISHIWRNRYCARVRLWLSLRTHEGQIGHMMYRHVRFISQHQGRRNHFVSVAPINFSQRVEEDKAPARLDCYLHAAVVLNTTRQSPSFSVPSSGSFEIRISERTGRGPKKLRLHLLSWSHPLYSGL